MNRNLIAIILIAISIGIYVTVTEGVIAQGKAVKTVNDQYVSAIGNAVRLISVRDQVLQEYNSISDNDRARIDKMIPSTVDNIRLIIDLNAVAARHNLTLSGVQASAAGSTGSDGSADPSSPAPAATAGLPGSSSANSITTPTLSTVAVSFGVTATYQQFVSFLQDLEADLRIMDLTSLTVASSNSGLYTFSVQFNTYWIRQ